MLGQAGSGKLRMSVGQSKLAAKVAKRFKESHCGSIGATSGLTSSLAFTPFQLSYLLNMHYSQACFVFCIELPNPGALAHQLGTGTQKYLFLCDGNISEDQKDMNLRSFNCTIRSLMKS
ncbi:hypothetical protein SLEP1_g32674 [Rubroshorea leprosula]|uniref:Prp31 C-terminal domain-containing protein n=1 Tax=Rubroshorea leprosula TaxID=152421 RepID=A0AAV5KE55_9ROSI|nr:hypothetical protein SLEP1_g32674 [Rubroshorea leprosula]